MEETNRMDKPLEAAPISVEALVHRYLQLPDDEAPEFAAAHAIQGVGYALLLIGSERLRQAEDRQVGQMP